VNTTDNDILLKWKLEKIFEIVDNKHSDSKIFEIVDRMVNFAFGMGCQFLKNDFDRLKEENTKLRKENMELLKLIMKPIKECEK
jgi:hypothetical protein